MTEENIALKVTIDNTNGAKSLKDLKQEFKDLQKELSGLQVGSEKYIQTLKKLGAVKDDIGDLNDTIKAFNPEGKIQAIGKVMGGLSSGFVAAQGAAALFGTENEDLTRTLVKLQAVMAFQQGIQGLVGLGDAFKVLGAIIKANPLFLIIGVVTAIGTALYSLKDKVGFIGDAFDFLGNIIDGIVGSFKTLTDAIGITNFAMEEMAELKMKSLQESLTATQEYIDREIKIQKAYGKDLAELERKKYKDIYDNAEKRIIILNDLERAGTKLTEKQIEERKELIRVFIDADTELKIIDINAQKQKETSAALEKKRQEDITKKYLDELNKRRDAEKAHIEEIRRLLNESAIEDLERRISNVETFKERQEREFAEMDAIDAFYNSLEEKKVEKRKKLTDDEVNYRIDAYQSMADGIKNISDVIFSFQLEHAKGNAEAERQIRRKQFNVNKAYGVTTATIDGVQAVQKTLATGGALAIPLAIGVGTLTTANVLKILAQQFNESGGGSTGSPNVSITAPNIAPPTQGSTQLNTDGTVRTPVTGDTPTVRAVVVETDVTSVQKKIKSIEANSKI